MAASFVGGTLFFIVLFVQYVLEQAVVGYTLVFIGLALIGTMLVCDWVIARRDEGPTK